MSDTIIRGVRPVGVGPYRDVDKYAEQMAKWSAERQREYEISGLLDRELGLVETEIGRAVHMQAIKILASRGKADTYTDDEYVAACIQAGAR